jgi:hypothetical protein
MHIRIVRVMQTETGYSIDNLVMDGDEEGLAAVVIGNCKSMISYYSDDCYIGVDFGKDSESFNDPVELFNILTEFVKEYNDNRFLKHRIEKAIMNEIVKLFSEGADKIGIY